MLFMCFYIPYNKYSWLKTKQKHGYCSKSMVLPVVINALKNLS